MPRWSPPLTRTVSATAALRNPPGAPPPPRPAQREGRGVGAENSVTSCDLQILVYETIEAISSSRPDSRCRGRGSAAGPPPPPGPAGCSRSAASTCASRARGSGRTRPAHCCWDVDGAPEWWPINQVARTAVPPRVDQRFPCGRHCSQWWWAGLIVGASAHRLRTRAGIGQPPVSGCDPRRVHLLMSPTLHPLHLAGGLRRSERVPPASSAVSCADANSCRRCRSNARYARWRVLGGSARR
jgi:hypothetical protein